MSQEKEQDPSQTPKPIRRLEESLINRIAAGEIIHRPASALKELIENSLDARSTSIRITVKDGGMKLLQIQDNGCGIRKDDLPILAERFTTSKLSTFDDLSRITTYGFRGEALASMSHVAHLSVITKTKQETIAWKAAYIDGILVDPRTRQRSDVKACAGNDGTTIIIEDLFYNTPTRLQALRNTSEEYSRILDVITKYAIHNPKVSFSCKKSTSASPDIATPASMTVPQAIRLLYGHSIATQLLQDNVSSETQKEDEDEEAVDDDLPTNAGTWSTELHFTNPNYQAKKMVFLLFINHRLVESQRMKRSLEAVYHAILPKGSFPFVYVSLEVDPRCVDVNVHPTKREVHFLNEEEITERIADAMQQKLAVQGQSRTFEYQTLLTSNVAGPSILRKRSRKEEEDGNGERQSGSEGAGMSSETAQEQKKTYSYHKVRTSQKDRTLDSMFPVRNPTQVQDEPAPGKGKGKAPAEGAPTTTKSREVKESECLLTSVKSLRQNVIKGKHRQLTEILQKHTFVGIVDTHKCLSLIQYSTNLYLVNHSSLAEELFYQLGLRQFGDFRRLKLEPAPPLKNLLEIAVEAEDSTKDSNLSKAQIVEKIANVLLTHREMLAEYFSLDISESGHIQSLPLLLRDYIPSLDFLPMLLMRLGPQVDWTSEMECFDTFLRELAYFYSLGAMFSQSSESEMSKEEGLHDKADRWQIQHALFPAMRHYLLPPKSLLDQDVVQVASLHDLYKVFERC
ncbi:DNA mismatch repair protein MutL [Macrolepiota fuliginosa MF-IS2]|uniref:DNA mismatch repair protein MutL n=1 Tax=Macrolepiota fuliginosa MF-IS2 TaxID=1400762 RepID=A0A9P5XAH1_9AGAR|nr:DNA mismatch repair protein MutL [Macrolepiota fuliginosa MF-IS2]